MGRTSPNPPVGAVVVRNGEVLGTGATCEYGCDHAEVMALSSVRDRGLDPSGAEIYVTLEPCNHYGKTPPCTEGLISSGIRKVYIPLLDPNPMVAGRGVERLRQAGIEVQILDEWADSASDMLRPFRKIILTGKPFVIAKSAVTIDGRIATSTGDSRWISGAASRLFVHKLRNRVDAVVIGKNTFMHDNPKLTVRPGDFGDEEYEECRRSAESMMGRRNYLIKKLFQEKDSDVRDPLRVVIGLPADITGEEPMFIDKNHLVFIDEHEHALLVKKGLMPVLERINHRVINPDDRTGTVRQVLKHLAEAGVMFLMVEGGSGINASFLDSGAVDQFMYIIAPRVAGGGIPAINGKGPGRMSDSLVLTDITSCMIGQDVMFTGYREEYHQIKE